ncbi:hypothetical protein [Paludisphaera borealis]|uniref:Uncharacterized protein n=1 Tax=Paludisphaera borealis TaxID=1387353 RepID=A0A1U7CPS3_9BACT|nr:hypothetical protein [Paludisphaera borealis]APW60932.1 hypothetical protein BSF38_02426 [Paludisphaera borealis]
MQWIAAANLRAFEVAVDHGLEVDLKGTGLHPIPSVVRVYPRKLVVGRASAAVPLQFNFNHAWTIRSICSSRTEGPLEIFTI